MMTKQFRAISKWAVCVILLALSASAQIEQISLEKIVTPSTVLSKNGQPITFALHGFIEFKSLAEMFPYIESQAKRWPGQLSENERKALARDLLRRGIESRIISMVDERPLEALLTHTPEELQQALTKVKEPIPDGYADAFLAVQKKWRHSINCWSASSSLYAR